VRSSQKGAVRSLFFGSRLSSALSEEMEGTLPSKRGTLPSKRDVSERMEPSQGGLSLHKHKHTKRPTRTHARAVLLPPYTAPSCQPLGTTVPKLNLRFMLNVRGAQ